MIEDQALNTLEYGRVLQIISEYAASQAGRERVLSLRPSDDPRIIDEEFDRLAEMRSISTGEATFIPPETPVLNEPLARLTKPGVVLEGKEIVLFGKLFEGAEAARGYILRREDALPNLSLLAGHLDPFPDLHREINRIFDENDEVRSSASPLLGKLRKDARSVRERIEKKLEDIAEKLGEEGSSGENFLTLRQERYVLAILRSEMHSCPGIIQGESGSGNTLFIEPEQVVQLNNRLREIGLDIRREIYRILAGLCARLAEGREALKVNLDILARLDSLYARARYAEDYACSRPKVRLGEGLCLKQARHPLLILRSSQLSHPVVPLTLELDEQERTLLVSGPNAGGKTVLLKTAGIVALMAQSGIFPPVDRGTILPVFESVITAIGDEQSIDKDLSTFSAHVRELSQALEQGTPRSLVLLDEVGVGTDPAEGAALASAVLERLTAKGCLTLCTTHYGELKLLHERVPGLVNGSLEFDAEKLKPAFVFRKGLPGQSYGLVIARNMGLDRSVLSRAAEYMTAAVVNLNEYIARLENRQKELDRQLAALEQQSAEQARLRAEMELERTGLHRRAAELEGQEKNFAKRTEELQRRQLLESRREVEKVIERLEREYREQSGRDEAARRARQALEQKIRSLAPESVENDLLSAEPAPAGGPLNVGDRVSVLGQGFEGEIVEGPDASGKLIILAGRVRISVPEGELRKVPAQRPRKSRRSAVDISAVEMVSGAQGSSEKLDLRGMRSDEIVLELDRFLASALQAGLSRVLVVHGKGTGALRQKVTELLKVDNRVESFRPGAWNEGGIGATVISLAQ